MFFTPPKIKNYRADIDGLRGLAILFVVLFHTFPELFPGGFISVDVFFVISGFLISSIIFKQFNSGTFSYACFYSHRIRRIFPSLIFLLLGVLLLGCFLLTPEELKSLVVQICWGAFFGENLYLIKSTGGYWDQTTEMMPLMHLWTLAVEEQYYIFYPIVCSFLCKYKKLFTGLAALTLFSFLSIYLFSSNSILNFYSLHTRFWELCSGVILAYLIINNKLPFSPNSSIVKFLSFVGVSLIFVGFFFITEHDKYPGIATVIPIVGTLLVIASQDSVINRKLLSSSWLVFIGLISYTWYLWHWPFLAFSRILSGGELPDYGVRVLILFLGLLLSLVSYFLIENPIRNQKASIKLTLYLSCSLFLVFVSATLIRIMDGLPQRLDHKAQLVLLSGKNSFPNSTEYCQKKFAKGSPIPFSFCYARAGEEPKIAVLGDFHNHHLLSGINKLTSTAFVSLGMGGTPPFPQVYKISEEPHLITSPEKSTAQQTALNNILQAKEIKTVILSARWNLFLNNPEFYGLTDAYPSRLKEHSYLEELFKKYMEQLLGELRDNQKKVILVLNVPEFPFSVDSCYRPLGNKKECGVSKEKATENTRRINKLLSEISSNYGNVRIVDPTAELCSEDFCSLLKDGRALYKDDDHLSDYGSEILSKKIISLIDEN